MHVQNPYSNQELHNFSNKLSAQDKDGWWQAPLRKKWTGQCNNACFTKSSSLPENLRELKMYKAVVGLGKSCNAPMLIMLTRIVIMLTICLFHDKLCPMQGKTSRKKKDQSFLQVTKAYFSFPPIIRFSVQTAHSSALPPYHIKKWDWLMQQLHVLQNLLVAQKTQRIENVQTCGRPNRTKIML